MIGLADRVLVVVAMVVAIRPIVAGAASTAPADGRFSWRRGVVLVLGGLSALGTAVGLLVMRKLVLGDEAFMLPTWLGATLPFFAGMLGVSTLLSPRGERGMGEDRAIRHATQALAMVAYLAAPRASAAFLGLTRLGRACLPWTLAEGRWLSVVEGLALLGAAALPRDPTLGGLLGPTTFATG